MGPGLVVVLDVVAEDRLQFRPLQFPSWQVGWRAWFKCGSARRSLWAGVAGEAGVEERSNDDAPGDDASGGSCRGYEERRPAFVWHQLHQGGDECPVRPGEAGTCDLATPDGQLVTEDEDLGILGRGDHPMDPKQFTNTAYKTLEEAERHARGALLPPIAAGHTRNCIVGPFRLGNGLVT